jgi:hypothetical protein
MPAIVPPPAQQPQPTSAQGSGFYLAQDSNRMSRPDPRDGLSIEVMKQYLTLMLHPNTQPK